MNTIQTSIQDKIAVITLNRPKSNAINTEMVRELQKMVQIIEQDKQSAGLIITGQERFFSAGIDLIELYDYNETEIKDFWVSFLKLTATLVSFKKPMVAAINGHSPAGGCIIALCADYRVMAEGDFIIGLNEIPIGIIVPENIFSLYAYWIGKAAAHRNLLSGKLLTVQEALQYRLVDEVVKPGAVLQAATRQLKKYLEFSWAAWQQTKLNMRKELTDRFSAAPDEILEPILEQWWSPNTRAILETVIRNLKGSK